MIFIVGILGVVFETANGFCFHAVGGVGEYHQECDPHDTGVGKISPTEFQFEMI